MKRRVLAGVLGLAVAGCAQGRSTQIQASKGIGPVGLEPLPSIHQTINAGLHPVDPKTLLAGKQPDRGDAGPGTRKPTSLADAGGQGRPAPFADRTPSSPRPHARDDEATVASASAAGAESSALGAAPSPASDSPSPASTADATVTSTDSPASASLPGDPAAPSEETPATLMADRPGEGSQPVEPGSVPAAPATELAPTPAPLPVAEQSPSPSPSPSPEPEVPVIAEVPAAAEPPAEVPAPTPAATAAREEAPSLPEAAPTLLPTDPIPSLPSDPTPSLPAEPSPPQPTKPTPPAPTEPPPSTPAEPTKAVPTEPQSPAEPPLPGLPPSEPPPSTNPAPAPTPGDTPAPELPPLPELPPDPGTTKDSRPAPEEPQGGEPPMTLPPLPDPGPSPGSDPMPPMELPPLPPDSPAPAPVPARENPKAAARRPIGQSAVARPQDLMTGPADTAPVGPEGIGRTPVVPAPDPPAPRDPAVTATAHETASVRSEIKPSTTPQFSEVAARVGDEVITLHELRNAYAEYKSAHFPPGQSFADSEKVQLVKLVLDNLIDRALTLQEAKRMMKNPKQWDKFKEFADKAWEEEELPPLLRKYAAANVYELRQKLAAKNKSLDTLREDFRLTKMSREFVHMKVWPKLKVDLTEMRDYYNDHLDDFDRSANITWREIVVETKAFPDRVQARRKAEEILDRLRHGEDFGKVAKAASQGPTASEGGLWNTSPGSYAVNAVNQALGTIPLKQVSPILEGPDSFHIIRVEGRREAGPARFDEVQDEIRTTLIDKTFQRETKALIDGLRAKTLVKTKLDDESAADGDEHPRVVPATERR